MKNLINSVKMKLVIKSLMANGTSKNISLKVGGNRLTIGEIVFVDSNENSKANFSFNKDTGGSVEVSGDHSYKITINNITISGDKGEEFSMERLEFNCISEALELFASLTKQ